MVASLGKFGSPDTFQSNVSSGELVKLLKTGPEVEESGTENKHCFYSGL